MKPSKSIETAMNRERRRELSALRRERKAKHAIALGHLTKLRKEADKIIRNHAKGDKALARRMAILEGRLA